MIELEIYIADNCWACEETKHIIAETKQQFPMIEIRVYNINEVIPPKIVFATPTYLINGRIAYLGNPSRQEIKQKLITLLQNEQVEHTRSNIPPTPLITMKSHG